MGAVPVHHTATDDGTWDGPAQEKKLVTPLTAKVGNDTYAWVDPKADETTKSAWRYTHHFVASNGDPGAASTMACSTGIGVLNGARIGTTIPTGDKQGVWSHLAAHLKDAGVKEADLPELKSADELEHRAAGDEDDDSKPCPTCGGDGKIKGNTTKCPTCSGTGTVPADADTEANAAHQVEVERRRKQAGQLRGPERRTIASGPVEVRTSSDGNLHMSGYASVFDRPYDVGFYTETVKRGAFTKTLSDGAQVNLLLNHEGLPLASTKNGTLTLSQDGVGLKFDATLDSEDPDSQRVVRKINAGLMDECSFAFQAIRQDWNEDYTQRSLSEVSIDKGDVSIVNFGANPATSVQARGREAFAIVCVQAALDLIGQEERAGAKFSGPTMDSLKNILGLVQQSDTAVDHALVQLSALMGVVNPDIAQDASMRKDDAAASAQHPDGQAPAGKADGEDDPPATSSRSAGLPNYTVDARARLARLKGAV